MSEDWGPDPTKFTALIEIEQPGLQKANGIE